MANMLEVTKDNSDSISNLPNSLIDLIIELLPVRDAARSCVWSRRWRYVWSDLPSLVLDTEFWNDIKRHKLSSKPNIDYVSIVNRILLHHTRDIKKFVVDISAIKSDGYSSIDLWLQLLCGKGLKELSIVNLVNNTYTIPSCVFYEPQLINLSIGRCIIKTKESFTGFSKLQSLVLDNLTLNSWNLKTPLLTSLYLKNCSGVSGLNISAPKLRSLVLCNNNDFNLTPYLLCSNITYAYISLNKNIKDVEDVDFLDLVKLFRSWPALSRFTVDGSTLKYLTTGIVLDNLSIVLKLRRLVAFDINMYSLSWILHILGKSPMLKTCEIWLRKISEGDKASLNIWEALNLKYLEEQSIKNKVMMKQVDTIKIRHFKGSKLEIQFVKILLSCSPSLKLMLVEEMTDLNADERLKISKELMRFQRAYPKPEIIFGSYS